MKHNKPERLAWLVIFGAFGAFLMLCAAIPVSARSYLLYSISSRQARLEVIGGILSVQERGAPAPIAVTQPITLSEGSSITTNETSRGILTFFDGSTLTLFPNTQVTLSDMRESTFDWGRVPMTFLVEQTRGRIRIGAAPLYAPETGAAHTRVFQIRTPHMSAFLTEGSFAFDVTADSSQVTANDGSAEVLAQETAVSIARRQRAVVTRGNPPLAPLPAAQALVVNGDFMDPPDRGWNSFPDPTTPGVVAGKAEVASLGDRRTIHILRTNSATPSQTSAITGVIQQVNREVSDFRILKLAADVRLRHQSLSGGGVLSSEYPLILRLKYRDQYGSEGEWVHGFYYQNVFNNPTNNGELVPQDVWVPFESGNLFEIAEPRPFYITSLQIYASGWDYESWVSNVKLIVE
ncbi:MAG: FecR domain-containing protein [Chloroflexi bacterium]|nr:FecR domain-containing protein [Chloroflexota bacterium]